MKIPALFKSTVSILIIGGLLAFAGLWAFGKYNGWREANRTDWKAKYSESQDSVKLYREASERDSIQYVNVEVPKYIRVRDAAIADPSTPASTRACFNACDLVRAAGDSVQSGLRGQVRSLETQNELLRNKPGPPKVSAYGDVLYDVVGLRPVFRTGGNVKVLGPLHVRVEGEYAIPSTMRSGVGDGFRVLMGARINLNR